MVGLHEGFDRRKVRSPSSALGSRFFFERDLQRGTLVELSLEGATGSAIGGYKFVAREDRWSTPRIASSTPSSCASPI